MDIDLVDFYWY